MAKAGAKQEFGDVVSQDPDGTYHVKTQNLPGSPNIVLEGMTTAASVKFKVSVIEQTDSPAPNGEKKPLQHGDITKDGWAYVGVNEEGRDVFAKGYGVKKMGRSQGVCRK